MQLNGSQIFVEVLCEQGVDTLFGYPGGAVLNLYDELYKNSDRITHVLTAHEQGAAHAADGYARATGRTGVVLASAGCSRYRAGLCWKPVRGCAQHANESGTAESLMLQGLCLLKKAGDKGFFFFKSSP